MLELGHDPRAGNHGVGLEEFLRGVLAHLGRYDAQEIVLNPDDVHGGEGPVLDDYLQRPGKLLCLTPFPVEALAYRHVVKFKGGLGEECRWSLFLEEELVVESPVIVNLTLAPGSHARPSPVGIHTELDARGGHDAHADVRLSPRETAHNLALGFPAYRDLVQDLGKQFRVKLLEVLRNGRDEAPAHVGTAGTHGEVIRAVGKIVV